MIEYETGMNKHNEMIRRFDEVLLEKASKVSIEEVYKHVDKYLPITNFHQYE